MIIGVRYSSCDSGSQRVQPSHRTIDDPSFGVYAYQLCGCQQLERTLLVRSLYVTASQASSSLRQDHWGFGGILSNALEERLVIIFAQFLTQAGCRAIISSEIVAKDCATYCVSVFAVASRLGFQSPLIWL